jgi:hypothetical protein
VDEGIERMAEKEKKLRMGQDEKIQRMPYRWEWDGESWRKDGEVVEGE